MNQIEYNSVKDQPKMFLTDLADSNYFNPRMNIVRVKSPFDPEILYDFRLAPSWYPPNPKIHRIILIASTEYMSEIGLTEDRLQLPPGIEDDQWTPAEIQMGLAYLVDRNQRLYVVDNQNGSTGFSIRNTNMFDEDNVKVALAPPIHKDYTNNSDQESDSNQIGLFMNDDVIMIRSRGAQITLGDEGIHFGGKQHHESTTHSKEIMQDNFIHQLIPSTIPTAAVSIPQLPNFGMIAQIAETANKVISVVGTAKSVITAVSDLA